MTAINVVAWVWYMNDMTHLYRVSWILKEAEWLFRQVNYSSRSPSTVVSVACAVYTLSCICIQFSHPQCFVSYGYPFCSIVFIRTNLCNPVLHLNKGFSDILRRSENLESRFSNSASSNFFHSDFLFLLTRYAHIFRKFASNFTSS
jgi:hypothetical protein